MTTMQKRRRQLLGKYLGPQWQAAAALGLLMLAATALQLINPRILGRFIDAVESGAAARDLVAHAATFLALATVGQAAALMNTYLSATIGWRATNALRRDLAAHVFSLDLGFHKSHTPGELIERIDGDVTMLSEFFADLVVDVIGSSLMAAGTLVGLSLIDWRAGLIGAGYVGAVLLNIRVLQAPASEAWGRLRESETALYGQLSEQLYGMEDIRSSGAGSYVMRGLHKLMDEISRRRLKAKVTGSLQGALGHLAFAAAQAAGLALGIRLTQRGDLSLGSVVAILSYIALLTYPVHRIQRQAGNLQRATAGIRRIHELLETRSRLHAGGSATLPVGPPLVAFRNVTFAYRDGAPEAGAADPVATIQDSDALPASWALRDLSFELAPGRCLGLLGRTGSGKSTVTRLLYRLYDPDAGSIELGRVGLQNLPLAALRSRIGLVTQDVQVFRATVRDNLTLFDPAVPDDRLLEAIELLGLRPWLNALPDGLDTPLGTGSAGLSAGEAQLLDLTRVFLRDPDVVVLDEASARLDPLTEQLLNTAISRLIEDRTTIIVAHRLSTVDRADEIMILDEGRCAEYGDRSRLAADPDSRFSRLRATGMQAALA